MVNPVKIFLSSSLISMQNFVDVSDTVCAYVGGKVGVRTKE